MLRTRSLQYISPSCPQGGTWFACSSGSRFLGCCGSDPCQNGCPQTNLKAASFNATDYGQFTNQNCVTGQFYTCENTNPPFLGCCTSNPCDAGQCPPTDLAPALLSNDPIEAADFLSTATTATSTTLSATMSTSTAATRATMTPNPSSPPAHTRVSNGAIIGIALGGFLFCAWLLAISMFIFNRWSRLRKLSLHEKPSNSVMESNDYTLGVSASGNANNNGCSPLSHDSSCGTWMSPVSLGISHESSDSPTLDSVEIAELDGTCVERGQWRTSERTEEDHQRSLLELNGIYRRENGINVRSQPVYFPYYPGARQS